MQHYDAKTGYLDPGEIATYESDRFGGRLGRYRYRRERASVAAVVDTLPQGLSVLDCPCGIGRWWPVLARRATAIIAVDVSPAMVAAARERLATAPIPVSVFEGDAEHLDLASESVDAVFCHALMKHLPADAQALVLAELARLSRRWIICSFSLAGPVGQALWRRRETGGSPPLTHEQLSRLAASVNLRVVARRRCSTPIGVQHVVLMERTQTA